MKDNTPINIFQNPNTLATEDVPTLFTPKIESYGVQPDVHRSKTADFILKYSPNLQGAEPIKDSIDAYSSDAYATKKADTYNSIKSSLQVDDGIPLENKIKAAGIIAREGVIPESPGEIFKKQNFPNQLSTIDQTVDKNIFKEFDNQAVVQNMGGKPEQKLKDVMEEPNPELSKELLTMITKNKTIDTSTMSSVASWMMNSPIINPLKRAEAVWDVVEGADKAVADAIKNKTLDTLGIPRDATMKDVVEYLSFIPKNPEAEIDMGNFAKIVFSKDTLTGRVMRLKQWHKEFINKYGEDGYTQMAAFMAKEGIVDGVALTLALKNKTLAKGLVVKTSDALFARMAKAMGRATVMGLAGTGVQQSMDRYLGFNTPTSTELGTRVGGALVGEGIAKVVGASFKVVGATFKGLYGAGSRAVKSGVNLFTDEGSKVSGISEEALQHVVSEYSPALKPTTNPPLDMASQIGLEAQGEGSKQILRATSQEVKNAATNRDLGTLGHIFDRNPSEIEADIWVKQNNPNTMSLNKTLRADIMTRGVGNRLVGETTAAQTEVDKVLHYYFDTDNMTVVKRPATFEGDTSPFRVKEYFSEPRNFIGDMADNLYDIGLNKNALASVFQEAYKAAFKGLDKDVAHKVVSVRELMEEASKNNPWHIVDEAALKAKGLTDKEIDSYFALGKVMDFTAIHAENIMLNSAQKQGLKQLADGSLVQVMKRASDETSFVKNIKTKQVMEISNKDMIQPYRIMGYKPNFVPRRPENPDFLIGHIDPTNGKVELPIASKSRSEATDKVLELEQDPSLGGKIPFYVRNHTGEQSVSFGMGGRTVDAMDALGEDGIAAIKRALANSGRNPNDVEAIKLGLDNITYGSVKDAKIAGTRGEGLKDVYGKAWDYKPGEDSITQYLFEASSLQMKDFRNEAIKQFQKDFSEILNPQLPWNQELKNVLGKSDLVQRAKSVQGFIRRNIMRDTGYGAEIRAGIDAWVDNMVRSGKGDMIRGIEKMPLVNQLLKQTRDGTAFVRKTSSVMTFAGNISSFITQTMPSIAMVSGMKLITNPSHLAKGWKDLMGIIAVGAGLPENLASAEIREARKALLKSGVISGIELQDMGNVAFGQSNYLYSKAMYFVEKGEEVNRANIWLTIRAEMIDKLKKQELLSLDGHRLLPESAIDGQEFLQIVSTKAKQVHLDVTQAGQLKVLSGIGATIGQFSAPIIKTHTMWFAKDLTPKEKIGASLGLFTLFGMQAVPFVAAGMYVADKTGELLSGGDEISDYQIVTDMSKNIGQHMLDGLDNLVGFSEDQKKFFKDTTKKGLIYSLSGSEMALYQKMAVGLFFQQTVEGFSSEGIMNIPSVSILTKAAESADHIGEMLTNLYQAYNMTPEEARQLGVNTPTDKQKVLELHKFIGEVMNETGNILPGVGKIVDVMNNHPDTRRILQPTTRQDDLSYVQRNGKTLQLTKPLSDSSRLMMLFGIVPGEVQKNRDTLSQDVDRAAQIKKLGDTWVEKYKDANTEIAKFRVRREAMVEAANAEKLLAANYMGALVRATGGSTARGYKPGTLGKIWNQRMMYVDMDRISANRTLSKGE